MNFLDMSHMIVVPADSDTLAQFTCCAFTGRLSTNYQLVWNITDKGGFRYEDKWNWKKMFVDQEFPQLCRSRFSGNDMSMVTMISGIIISYDVCFIRGLLGFHWVFSLDFSTS